MIPDLFSIINSVLRQSVFPKPFPSCSFIIFCNIHSPRNFLKPHCFRSFSVSPLRIFYFFGIPQDSISHSHTVCCFRGHGLSKFFSCLPSHPHLTPGPISYPTVSRCIHKKRSLKAYFFVCLYIKTIDCSNFISILMNKISTCIWVY